MNVRKIMMMLASLVAMATNMGAGNIAPAGVETLMSPDGDISLKFTVTERGEPCWWLDFKDKNAVLPSTMGLELRGELPRLEFGEEIKRGHVGEPVSLYDGFKVVNVSRSEADETWEPVWGEESSIRNCYREMAVTLEQAETGRQMIVRFRLYDEGVGFRYEFPEQENLKYFVIKEELTQFAMTGDHTAWWIPGDYDTQEYDYVESRLSEIRKLMPSAVTPNSSQTPFSPTGVQTSLQMKTDDGLYITYSFPIGPLTRRAGKVICRPLARRRGGLSWLLTMPGISSLPA